MFKASFYCDIVSADGEIVEKDFNFDDFVASSKEEMDEYIEKSGYKVGSCCGYWGDSQGIYKEALIHEV